ncbi:MAG: DNA polymerase ligase N-terminal domain-containing protein, partial [Candidatus Nanoarchaeia archaeon]
DISVLLLMPIIQEEPKNNEYYPPKEKQWQQYYCLSDVYKKSGYQLYEELQQMDIESRLKYIDEILRELVSDKKSKKKTTEQIIGKNIMNMLKEENNVYPYKTKYVIHDHYATHHHFDLRIKKGNKLPSWALPKAYIPQNDGEKILAVRTPDHDLYWMTFKGEIPKGEYGAGKVDIYESGECIIHKWSDHIIVEFLGEKAKGFYSLIKTKGDNYLLLRMNQEEAQERYRRL